jgi:tRNA threonylcarbamoyladenosine biosynthesis protein TsaB
MTPIIILSIDTSSAVSYVSVSRNGHIFTKQSEGKSSHNEEIDSLVKSAVKSATLNFEDINEIIYGAGPGSFTGLRICSAYVKGLAMALEKPIYQYSSLEAPAYFLSKKMENALICCLADAGRGESFVSMKEIESFAVRDLLPLCILSAEELTRTLNVQKTEPIKFSVGCGDPAMPALSEALIAMHQIQTGNVALKKPYKLEEIAELQPVYLREVAAKTLKERGINIDF